MHFRYVYNCVNPDDFNELNFIIDNGEEITREEFIEKVLEEDIKKLEKSLGYNDDFKMENDLYVSYWKAIYEGKWIYYFSHSAIEYVFK